MTALKVCLLLALVAAAYAIPAPSTNDAAPAAEPAKEESRDISDIIEAAVTGEEDKLGLLPRVALKLVEAGGESARGKLKLKKLLPLLAFIPLIKLLFLPIAILFLKGLTLKALFIAKVALIFALINAGRSFFSKGGGLLSGLSGLGGGGGDHYTSYDAGHSSGGGGGHSDSYSGSSHHGYSRSLIDEAEAKVNSMIEAATKFFEGDEEPAKTE